MARELVKVYYPVGEEMKFAYCEMRGSFNAFVENINLFVDRNDMEAYFFEEGDRQRYRMFWIDEDNDKIMINSDYTLGVFLMRTTGIKKVYIVEKNAETTPELPQQKAFIPPTESNRQQSKSTSSPLQAEDDIAIHTGVQCDACLAIPIKGFRYKCAQCYDFDLCMQCEHKKLHSDHVMYRFPVALPREANMNRRFFKKMRHGCFGKQSESEEHRRYGRKQRHESHGGSGSVSAFTNFYTMMCDLAEGMDQQDPQNAAGETERKEEPARKEETTTNSAQVPTSPKVEVPIIDMSAGIEVLKNFSEIFGKLLDPLGITVEVDIGRKGEKKEKKQENEAKNTNEKDSNEKSEQQEKNTEQEPKESAKATAPEPENDATLQSADSSSSSISITKSSSNQSVQVNSKNEPVVDTKIQSSQTEQQEQQEPQSQSGSNDGANKKKDSIGIESGWTMIDDKHFAESRNTPTTEQPDSTRASVSPPNDINYEKLSQDLLGHIQNEMKAKKPEIETRAQIVYHHDMQINNAVIAMMAMGFSNEGNWLTNLLETVNGDIPKALELLHPSR